MSILDTFILCVCVCVCVCVGLDVFVCKNNRQSMCVYDLILQLMHMKEVILLIIDKLNIRYKTCECKRS